MKADKINGGLYGATLKDASVLHKRLTPYNKDLVSYMLDARDADNKIMFPANRIIEELDKIHAEMSALRAQNPDFGAKDVKAYYDNILAGLKANSVV